MKGSAIEASVGVKQGSVESVASNEQATKSSRKIFVPIMLLVLVLVLALLVLIYIAYIDATQSYTRFLLDRVNSNGELLERSIESLLQSGLPLQQLVGFDEQTRSYINNDDVIYDITIINAQNEVLFSNTKAGFELTPLDSFALDSITLVGGAEVASVAEIGDNEIEDYKVFRNSDVNVYQLRFPLDARFDSPGTLLISMPESVVFSIVNGYIFAVILFAIAIVIVYLVCLLIFMSRGMFSNVTLNVLYNICFILVAGFLVGSLISIYQTGLQDKAQALANSLSDRLSAIQELGLDLSDISDIDVTLTEYKSLNPDIEYIALIDSGVSIGHTDPEFVGEEYVAPASVIGFDRLINERSANSIAVAIPRRLLFQRLLRNIKNFSVLFLASGFLSWLLLRILLYVYPDISSVQTKQLSKAEKLEIRKRSLLDLAFPAFFLANFVEGLHYSYLPNFFADMARDVGVATSRVGAIYAVYWAMYALILVPAGRIARSLTGVRQLLVSGFTLIAASMVLVASVNSFNMMYVVRTLAGLGQGMVFIAIQSYLLQQADDSQRTEGVSIIVYGYNGGVISGTVIGALLVSSLGVNTMLFISAFIALMMMWYSITVIGRTVPPKTKKKSKRSSYSGGMDSIRGDLYTHGQAGIAVNQSFFKNLIRLITDPQFAKTILCVGLLTKAVLAGVVFLVLPQFLDNLKYRQEDIGQILMFYAIGVLLVSRIIARFTDRIGETRRILFFGSIFSAVGLGVIASAPYFASPDSLVLQSVVFIVGMFILGLSHGFIHAPIVTHITRQPIAQMIDRTVVASIYRFIERIGHVLGPLIFGQILVSSTLGIGSIYYVAVIVAVGSVLFVILPDSKTMKIQQQK